MSESLKVFMDDEEGAVCTFGNVVYVVWRSKHSTAPFDAADAAIAQLVARCGDGRKLCYVHRAPDRPGFQRSDGAVRQRAMVHFRKHEARFAAAALAIEASGFAAALFRSISAGVILLMRTQMAIESFRDARDAVRWLADSHAGAAPFDAGDVVAALERAGFCVAD